MDFNIPHRTLNNYWSKFCSLSNPPQPVTASDVISRPAVSQPEIHPLEELKPETPVSDFFQAERTQTKVPPLPIPPPNMLLIGYAKTGRVGIPTIFYVIIFLLNVKVIIIFVFAYTGFYSYVRINAGSMPHDGF